MRRPSLHCRRALAAAPVAALALSALACNPAPPERHAEPLVVAAAERDRTLSAHAAVAVADAPSTTYVAGRAERVADCTRCHEPGTAARQPRTAPGEREAHWDVTLDHAADMNCRTCHDPTAPAELRALGAVTDVDHGDRLCGSCHQGQRDDWLGGAHGKRHTGWAGPRVIHACAECHDPHAPALAPRRPVARPTIVPPRLATKGAHP